SCTTCPTPLASPTVTTPYVVTGTNSVGCTSTDTVVVTVIQPFSMNVSPSDSICIGQSANLMASGASTYTWTPSATLNSGGISNPVATPTSTTTYRVVGHDGFNCFSDTAFVIIGVGRYPTVNLGPDVTLSTGTELPLNTTITNGPIRDWVWTPSEDLSCDDCPLPIATIRNTGEFRVLVRTHYGCEARDTIKVKAFCHDAQVFIPNAFTPDNDGINDILMVRGTGIVSVKTFRIFNRWGEVVFERSSFPPNNPAYGWDGKVRGKVGGPDVYVYTAEVICTNGTPFFYKGNVSIIK
ncbi:MAG: gliding motility-associated C-terminal domain-containing protein, partial [Sphingobacteriales bacterium]